MLDDFGIGFASLETLTSLPISGVKLDRRFTGQVIDGEREPAVVKAMISMAAEAGLEVIAEGVETQTQCDRLVRLGCRLGQGYLFALPLPPDSMTTVLSAPLVSLVAELATRPAAGLSQTPLGPCPAKQRRRAARGAAR